MDVATQMLIAVGLAVFLPVIVTYVTTTYNTDDVIRYFWGDRKIQFSQSAHLLTSTAFAVNGVLYFAFLGFWIGWPALILQVFWCGSYLLLARSAHRIKSLSRFGTLHGAIGSIYGAGAERAAAVASVIGFTLIIGWEISIGTSMFQAVSRGSEGLAQALQITLVVLFAGIGAIYTALGGLRGNIRANQIQNVVAGLALLAILGFFVVALPSTGFSAEGGALNRFVVEFGLAAILSNALFSLAYQFVDMSAWQNLAATESEGQAQKKALKWTAAAVFVFPGVIGTLLGIYLRVLPNVDANNIMTVILQTFAEHPFLLIFVMVGLMGAMLSAVDGFLLAAAQSFVWDLTHRDKVDRILEARIGGASGETDSEKPSVEHNDGQTIGEDVKSDERTVLRWTRFVIMGIALTGAVVTSILSIQLRISMFDLVYIAYTAQMALLPVALSALARQGKRSGGFSSILAGLFAGGAFLVYVAREGKPELYAWAPIISAAAATLVWFFAGLKGRPGRA